MDVLQEGAGLIVAARPVAHDGDVAPVGEAEAGDVDGVAEGVLEIWAPGMPFMPRQL